MGLDLRNQQIVERDERWEITYMPAFRDYFKEHEHINVPRIHDVLGKLVSHIRTGNTTIPPQYDDELMGMGFFYSATNLAHHVARVLGRTLVSLENDTEAQDAVAKAAEHHATLRALRSSLTKEARVVANLSNIPLKIKTIGNGVARFYADVVKPIGGKKTQTAGSPTTICVG